MNYWIWLSTIKNLGPIRKKKLLDAFETPEKIYKSNKKDLIKVDGIGEEIIYNIENSKDIDLLLRYENYIQKHNIRILNINDNEYPSLLKNIYDPPITLYIKGDISYLNKVGIAIIGCRDATEYGLQVASTIAYSLSSSNIVIISGLARGIDTTSHIAAIAANGKTIAVLGNGVDVIYPPENYNLYKNIIENGIIISEYIVGTKPNPYNFPQRNRIISGLSKGVVVIEAKIKSGTMITTDFALEQGKELYAVPGNIFSKQSEGTNELIKQGAKVLTNVSDILEDLKTYN